MHLRQLTLLGRWRRRRCRKVGHAFTHTTVDAYYCWANWSQCQWCGFGTYRAREDSHA